MTFSDSAVSTSRPTMPGYGLLPAAEGEGLLSWEWVSRRMAAARNYWICTTRPDGRPHAAPVWGVWVDDTFFFGTGEQSRKGRNLAHNPAVVVHLESGDEVVVLEGEARRRPISPAVQKQVAAAYKEKYDFDAFGENGEAPYSLQIHVAFAWREHDFPGSATRWVFA